MPAKYRAVFMVVDITCLAREPLGGILATMAHARLWENFPITKLGIFKSRCLAMESSCRSPWSILEIMPPGSPSGAKPSGTTTCLMAQSVICVNREMTPSAPPRAGRAFRGAAPVSTGRHLVPPRSAALAAIDAPRARACALWGGACPDPSQDPSGARACGMQDPGSPGRPVRVGGTGESGSAIVACEAAGLHGRLMPAPRRRGRGAPCQGVSSGLDPGGMGKAPCSTARAAAWLAWSPWVALTRGSITPNYI